MASQERLALICGLCAVTCWSTVATAFKLALRELDVLQLMLIACTCSALCLLVVLWRQQKLKLLSVCLRAAPGYYVALSLLNPVFYYLVLFWAYDLLPAQQAMAINYSWALTLALLAIPLLGQRPHMRDLVAALIAYGGIVVIATQGDLSGLHVKHPVGIAVALFSTILWALYWIFNTRNDRDAVASLCLNFLLATPVVAILCALYSNLCIALGPAFLAAVYVGVFEMGLAFVLWSTALRLTRRVARISTLIFLSPLLSLVFIYGVLGEPIHVSTLWGLTLILPATLWQQMRSEPEPKLESES